MKERIMAETASKSTVLNYVNSQKNKGEDTGTRKEYVNKLTRYQVRNLIIARSKRLPTKVNHQYKYDNKKCRWCGTRDETDDHVLRVCRENQIADRDFKGLFGERDEKEWRKLAEHIKIVIDALKNEESKETGSKDTTNTSTKQGTRNNKTKNKKTPDQIPPRKEVNKITNNTHNTRNNPSIPEKKGRQNTKNNRTAMQTHIEQIRRKKQIENTSRKGENTITMISQQKERNTNTNKKKKEDKVGNENEKANTRKRRIDTKPSNDNANDPKRKKKEDHG